MSAPFRLRPYYPSEWDDQVSLVKALRMFAPADLLFFHIPNQSNEGPKRGKFLKDMGRLAGAADLCFVRSGRTHFLEMKDRDQPQTATQEEFERRATLAGATYTLTRSLNEAHRVLFDLGLMDRNLLGSA